MEEFSVTLEMLKESWKRNGCPGRVLIAFSGGADSTALTLLLHTLTKEESLRIFAHHVHHGMRNDADQDEAFCSAFCKEHGIPYSATHLHLGATASEDTAREARYTALFEAARASRCEVIALAHHASDQAETILMRLMRGAANGLCGMREWTMRESDSGEKIHLWRPMLQASPDILRDILRTQGIAWREDLSNADTKYLRNFVRSEAMPLLKSRAPGIEKHLCEAGSVLYAEGVYLDELSQQWLSAHACLLSPCRFILGADFDLLPLALKRRCIHLIAGQCNVSADFPQTEAVCNLAPGQSVNWPHGWRVSRSKELLHFISPSVEALRPEILKVVPAFGKRGDGIHSQAFPAAALRGVRLRYLQSGDYIRPLGMHGHSRSMQDYLTDRKLDAPFRPYLPLLCKEHEVLWAIGLGVGEGARITAENEAGACFLTYPHRLPMEMKYQLK